MQPQYENPYTSCCEFCLKIDKKSDIVEVFKLIAECSVGKVKIRGKEYPVTRMGDNNYIKGINTEDYQNLEILKKIEEESKELNYPKIQIEKVGNTKVDIKF